MLAKENWSQGFEGPKAKLRSWCGSDDFRGQPGCADGLRCGEAICGVEDMGIKEHVVAEVTGLCFGPHGASGRVAWRLQRFAVNWPNLSCGKKKNM